jgi:hypothetical protein
VVRNYLVDVVLSEFSYSNQVGLEVPITHCLKPQQDILVLLICSLQSVAFLLVGEWPAARDRRWLRPVRWFHANRLVLARRQNRKSVWSIPAFMWLFIRLRIDKELLNWEHRDLRRRLTPTCANSEGICLSRTLSVWRPLGRVRMRWQTRLIRAWILAEVRNYCGLGTPAAHRTYQGRLMWNERID